MTTKDKTPELAYRVIQITSLYFLFKDIPPEKAMELFKTEESLELGVNTDLDINQERSTLTIDLHTQLKEQGEEQPTLVKHTGRTVFEIKGLSEVYDAEKETFSLPDELMVQLFALAYNHSRALLAVEVSPTVYKDHYMLPVIDPKRFLKNNAITSDS